MLNAAGRSPVGIHVKASGEDVMAPIKLSIRLEEEGQDFGTLS